MMIPPERPVLFFDGVCNLCNRFVQFVIRHDKQQQFLFAPLQSPSGKTVLEQVKENGVTPDSVVLHYKGRIYLRSAAALKTCMLLGGIWSVLAIAYVIPAFLRDRVYEWVAKNRYRWYGKRDSCMIPTSELKARFLSE